MLSPCSSILNGASVHTVPLARTRKSTGKKLGKEHDRLDNWARPTKLSMTCIQHKKNTKLATTVTVMFFRVILQHACHSIDREDHFPCIECCRSVPCINPCHELSCAFSFT